MSHGKAFYRKMCDLQEVNNKAITATDGPHSQAKSHSGIWSMQQHSDQCIWTVADQSWSETLKEAQAIIFTSLQLRKYRKHRTRSCF